MIDPPPPPTAAEWAAADAEHEREMAYWRAHRDELFATYPEEYVAVYAGELIAHATDLLVLLDLVRGLGIDPRDTWTRWISDGRRRLLV